MMSITLVSGNSFQVLGVRAAMGRALAASDDDASAPRPVVVLSDGDGNAASGAIRTCSAAPSSSMARRTKSSA